LAAQASSSQIQQFTSAEHPTRRIRRFKELLVESLLFFSAFFSVLVTLGIVFILVNESLPFFKKVPLKDFLTDKQWTPLFDNAHYGILPLLSGTFLTTIIAVLVSIPFGTVIATYLSEYAGSKRRESIKPILELLAAVPTVVYGYFALLYVTPLLQKIFPQMPGFNVLSAGLVMGVMIIPYVASLTEDAMGAVPNYLREGSYSMGATKLQTSFRVVYPSALSGIYSAYILGISRALGETMVVTIAAGMQPNLTIDPTEPAATITAFIVQVSLGDAPHGSIGYQSIYTAGLTLLVITLIFNLIGFWLRKKYREVS
jgi:phosphate transport system permease protein